jgi:tRNA-intron endonuclease
MQFGERKGDKVVYSMQEALFLVDNNKMDIYDSRQKNLSKGEIEKKFEKIDKRFKIKYIVFQNLRKKGFILKSALKFGADFRVYEKGKKIGENHSKWLIFVVSDKEKVLWNEFTAKNRIAHSTRKELLLAIVDEEQEVTYFETKWLKPQ